MTRRSPLLAAVITGTAAVLLAGLAGPALAGQSGASSAPAKATKTTKAATTTAKGCKNPRKCTTRKPTSTKKSCKNPKKCGATPTGTGPGTPTTTGPTTTGPTTTGPTTTGPVPTTSRPTGPTPTPTLSSSARTPGTLAGLTTAGRVKDTGTSWQFSWPGVAVEGSFTGTSVGVNVDDVAAWFDVQVDGATVATLNAPSATSTHWITGLAAGTHTFRLVKRSESTWSTATFSGLVAGPGGAVLAMPRAPRPRQIEFIGDSYTAGYGNLSTSRSCSDLNRMSNADVAFGALAARALDADYQLNAFSGRGMVRNYGGGERGTSFRTYYDRALLAVDGDVWQRPASWKPQVVVIGLGINDFSTALNGGEPWANTTALTAAYRTAYKEFVAKLRAAYGPSTVIVASATYVHTGTEMADNVQQVVRELNAAGDANVAYWYYSDEGWDKLGCDWHPSAADHRIVATKLQQFLGTLRLTW